MMGIGMPVVQGECDVCEAREVVPLISMHNKGEWEDAWLTTKVFTELERLGWVTEDGELYCPRCASKSDTGDQLPTRLDEA
jgi:hypothetical protein